MSGPVLIMAGGTGGHIYPGLAVAEALRARGVAVHWLGAEGGMESQKVPPFDIPFHAVQISSLRGKGVQGWLSLPLRLGRAVRQAGAVFTSQQPACAVSFGGYVAGPGGLCARLRGVPLVVHEQNRIPGMTNKTLARFARVVLQAFDGAFPQARTVGNPVRADLAALAPPAQRWKDRSGSPRLLVTGGSQGARALNRLLPAAMATLAPHERPLIRHQTGLADLEGTQALYRTAGLEAEVEPFIDDMAAAYGWADLVLCRSGALTVSELAAVGLGALLVPFPHAVDDHQTANAQVLVAAGAAELSQEHALDAEKLAQHLHGLLADRQRCLRMAEAARSVAVPHAAEAVAEACLEWVNS